MDFTALKDYIEYLPHAGVPGCEMAVWMDHREIFRCRAGFRDDQMKVPMRGDELYWIYSCSKVPTTCAAMQLIEQGKLDLDDPVAMYLPAFAELTVKDGAETRPARKVMTIRHLMSMQSGLNYDLERPAVKAVILEKGDRATTRDLVDAMAKDPLEFEPGTDFMYGLSHDVLAAVIEVVSGEKFSDYLNRHIFAPLGIRDFSFRITTPEQKNRFCAAWTMGENGLQPNGMDGNNFRLSECYESGGAGLLGSVQGYITMLDALACDGMGKDGQHILSPEMIQLWRSNQLGFRSRRSFYGWRRVGYSYGLGVRTRMTTRVGGEGPLGEFGWDGAAGAWGMIDPENHVSAYFGMHVRNFGYSWDVIHPNIRGLIYKCLAKEGEIW